jgi:serine/threonine protein kinase
LHPFLELAVFNVSLESERSRGYFPGYLLANRYELLRPLGEGGTGVVWVAHDRVLNLEVAVKLVREFEAANDDFARRTQLEASSAARIAHPAVCRALDFGLSEHGEPFVVSELLEGESLDDAIVRTGRLEATHAVRLLLPILEALRAAHESGIIHCDVKPANIFLARDGLRRLQPKLLDFGIACWLGDTSEAGICGTPHYMSPEQAQGGGDVDGRSDLWSFCATLYETLTGVVPFWGENHESVLRAVQSAEPEPITTFCTGDDALSAIVLRGLQRHRDARWQSARELSGELCRWLLAQGVETDVCDHSLRARLVDRAERDSRRDTPHAQVLPRYHATRGGSTQRDDRYSERAARARSWKRFGTILAATAAVVAATMYFSRAFPAHAPPLEALRGPAAGASPPVATSSEPLPQVVALPSPVPVEPAPHGVAPSVSSAAHQPAVAPPPLAVPRVPSTRMRPIAAATSVATPSAIPPVTPAPAPPASRQRSNNALHYDFGF